jgi:ABC-type phosphate transport system substrate-binding protein
MANFRPCRRVEASTMVLRAHLALLVLLAASASASAQRLPPPQRVLVVVHPSVSLEKVDKEKLKNLFLGKVTQWTPNLRVKLLGRPYEEAPGREFFRVIMKMTPARYHRHWQQLKLPEPEVMGAPHALVSKVATTPGSIGYLLESERKAADARVKLVTVE